MRCNALLALGYSDKEARAALAKLDPGLVVQEAIRQALRLLSKVLIAGPGARRRDSAPARQLESSLRDDAVCEARQLTTRCVY